MKPVFASVAAALAAAASSLAVSQAEDQSQRREPSADIIEEIVVTARKREESLQDVPVAVSAFTREAIEERQLESVNDIARFTPGLVFDKAFGRATERPVIRGQGNVLAGVQFGVEAGAAYFVDGVYYPGDIQSLDLNEVERVEVIRGPQSALYGRNTYSGAINFVTRSPAREFSGSARGSADKDEQEYSLRLEGPLGERASASLGLRRMDFDGQWTNQLTGEAIGSEETNSVAGVLDFAPTDNLDVRLRASYSEDEDGTRPFMFQDASFNNCFPGTRSLAYFATSGSLNQNQYFCGEIQPRPVFLNTTAAAGSVVTTPAVPATAVVGTALTDAPAGSTRAYDLRPGIAFSGVERELTLISGILNWDISGSGYMLTLDGAWRTEDRLTGSDSDFMSFNTFPATATGAAVPGAESTGANTARDEYDDYSVELKVASPANEPVRWMAGLFYYEQEQRTLDINFRFPEGRPIANSINDVFNRSIFGLVEWDFAPGWSVTAEGRYMEETKGLSERCTATNPPCNATVDAPGPSAFEGKGDFTAFTPRVTLKWQPTSDLNLYAVYAEGVKPGGFNGAAGLISTPIQPEYQQETSDNFELGLKSSWLGGRLLLNVAGYFIDATDIQLTTPIVRSDGSPVTSIATNQGSGEVRGVEVEARWRPIDPLSLTLTYALADSEFTEGCDDFQWTLTSGGGNNALRQGAYNAANPAAGGTNLNGRGDCSIVGNQFPLSAKNTGSLAADWRQPIGGSFELFVNADVSYTDKRPVQVHNLAFVPAATLVGARFGVANDNWTVALYGRNLTNEDAVAIATRWLQNPYIAISTIAIPGTAPVRSTASQTAAGLPAFPAGSAAALGAANVAAYSLPRSFFAMLRRERQVGLELTYRF
jgi:outer membrane receptor protein involved in Fe transport